MHYTKTTLAADVGAARERAAQLAAQQAEQVRKAQEADEQARKAAEQARLRAGIKLTVGGYLASPSQELLEQANAYGERNDKAVLGKLMATGGVISLRGGLQVEVVDSKIFKGLLKVRPRGETVEFWTVVEAVK